MAEARATGAALKEKVEAEAAAAEAEEPETEPAEPSETEDEDAEAEEQEEQAVPAEQKGRTDKQVKAMFDRALVAFQRKLAEVFEVEPDALQPAPHPGVIGFLLPGFTEPRTHDNFKRCETCNGLGKVLTGANTGKDENDWHACPDPRCAGRGYWQKQARAEPPPQTGPLSVVTPPAQEEGFGPAPAWMGDPSLSAQGG